MDNRVDGWTVLDEFADRLRGYKPLGLLETLAYLGDTPIERLRKLLDAFLYRDLATLDAESRSRVAQYLVTLTTTVTRTPWVLPALSAERGAKEPRWAVSLAVLRQTQRILRHALEELLDGKAFVTRPVQVQLGAARRHSDPKNPLTVTLMAPLPEAALYTLWLLVRDIPPQLLRPCPYASVPARPCGRIFVRYKSQRWCELHQKAAKQDRDQKAHQKRKQAKAKKRRQRRASRWARSR